MRLVRSGHSAAAVDHLLRRGPHAEPCRAPGDRRELLVRHTIRRHTPCSTVPVHPSRMLAVTGGGTGQIDAIAMKRVSAEDVRLRATACAHNEPCRHRSTNLLRTGEQKAPQQQLGACCRVRLPAGEPSPFDFAAAHLDDKAQDGWSERSDNRCHQSAGRSRSRGPCLLRLTPSVCSHRLQGCRALPWAGLCR